MFLKRRLETKAHWHTSAMELFPWEIFPTFNLNLPWHSLREFPLILSLVTWEKRSNPLAPASFSKISSSCSCCPALKICPRNRNEPHLTHKSHNQEKKTYSYKTQELPLIFISFKILKKLFKSLNQQLTKLIWERESLSSLAFGSTIPVRSRKQGMHTHRTQNARKRLTHKSSSTWPVPGPAPALVWSFHTHFFDPLLTQYQNWKGN